jgi:Trk K+ transport system NAD-binding subunit
MLLSAIGLALLYALAADAVIGARILEALGVPRAGLRGHVVVVGMGNTGYRIVHHLLDAGVEVAAADLSERNRFVAVARRQGVPVLVADGRYRDSLHALSVEGARAVVAATDDDLANLETALVARELNPDARIVARLFAQELAERAQQQLGLDACHSVSALAMPAFVAAALGDGVLSTVERDGGLWLLAELVVEPGSRADGMRSAALEDGGDLQVLAVRDSAAERWRPAHPDRLAAGDEVLVACSRAGWERACGAAGRT